MLSKYFRQSALKNFNATAKRAFASNVAVVEGASTPAELADAHFDVNGNRKWDNKGLNKWAAGIRAAEDAKNKDYFDMLNDTEARQAYFSKLTSADPNDHSEIAQVKSKINTLIEEELKLAGFESQLSAEEADNLANDTFAEVATNSNYFFSYDANKTSKNLKVFDIKAPGNKFRHPNVILPHEHIDVQHYIETKTLTEEKLYEIYAYYSLMVDMHIAQVRPGIIQEKSYVPAHMNQVNPELQDSQQLNNMFFEHYHRWREPTRKQMDVELVMAEQLRSRPTTDHYDHDKGDKYDVEWTEDQKFPHVATRLGYPEFREEPIERIVGFERTQAHPGAQFQPFLQTPPMEPDAGLNFENGEVIYENNKVGEWVKFWKASFITLFGLSPGFYIFEIYAGDGAPSLQWMSENWNWAEIPRQFQDGSGWDLKGYRYCDDHDYMNAQYGAKRSVVRPSHTMYVATLMAMVWCLDFDYVTKMRYNKDKDLVFVTKPDRFWGETEHIYEMHHLEQMVPSAVTAIKDMASKDENGIMTVHCMAQNEQMKFYKDHKFWNNDLRPEFEGETRGLWETTHADKYTGRIFQARGNATPDMQLMFDKVDREMTDAVKKHGVTELPDGSHLDHFYDRIEKNRDDIVSRA